MATPAPAALIARDDAASLLRQAFDAGREGTPQVVIVRGEAGIGKTRLLQEFRSAASATPSTAETIFAVGQCVDMGDIGSPYTPIRRLLRDLHAQLGDALVDAAAPATRAALAGVLPELSDDAIDSASADAVSDALSDLLALLSADHHLVLVIEDLHWADTATLALLKALSFTLRGTHLTVLMTYRTDDVGRGHPLRRVLADLERNRAVTFVELERLAHDDAARLTRLLAPQLDQARVERIVERSDGLPFFIEELVALDDDRLPETLRDLLLARVETLGPAARDTVDLLAAGGVHVDSDLLDEAADGRLERDRLHEGLREAIAASILTVDDAGYAFRHALLQEAVHDDVLPSIRSELHARYAAALDRRVAEGRPELAVSAAEHWSRARDTERAFDAMVIARRHSQSAGADFVASQIGERMLEMWPQIPDADERAGLSRLGLFAETAMLGLYDPRRSLRIAQAGLAEADADQRAVRADLLNTTAYALSNLGNGAGARQAGLDALELLDPADPATRGLLVECMISVIRTATFDTHRDVAEIERIAATVLTHSTQIDDPVLRVRALDAVATADLIVGRLDDALERVQSFPTTGLTTRQAQINLITELDVLVRLGRFREAIAVAREGTLRIASTTDVVYGISLNVAEALFAIGELEEGHRAAKQGLAEIPGAQIMSSFGWRLRCLADVWSDRGDLARQRAAAHAADIRELSADDGEELAGWAVYRIETALNEAETTADATARAALARTALDGLLDIERAQLDVGIARPHLVTAARALAVARRQGGDAEQLASVQALIADVLEQHGEDEATPAIEALVAAEAAPTADAWRQASDLAGDGFVPVRQRWYARYRLAQALLDSGEREEASALLDEIVAGAPAHGIDVVARWARELAARAGLSDADRPALPHLTAREAQVLELVAEGLTNPEIGARLFISPKTASVHVSAILAKIGAANRTEAASLFRLRQGDVAGPE